MIDTLTVATAPPPPCTRIVQSPFAPLLPCPVADTRTVVEVVPIGAADGLMLRSATSAWHVELSTIVPLGPDCCTLNDAVGCCDVSVNDIGLTYSVP